MSRTEDRGESDRDVAPYPRSTRLVIIPAFNEASSLPRVLPELCRELPDLDIVVISDGSTDATAQIARAAGVAVIELPFNLGIGGALRTGFRYAAKYDYEAAVQFDADGQHDPHSVVRLLDGVAAGGDLVIGSRFIAGATPTYRIGRARRVAMKGLELLVSRIIGQHLTDTSSGFRGFSQPMLAYFAENYPVEYMDSVEALVIAANAGFTLREVPAGISARIGGAPSTRSWRLAYYYVRLVVVLLTSYSRPSHRHRVSASPASEPRPERDGLLERSAE